VGAARIITLRCTDGTWDGYVLELRRMLDGTLGVRIFRPGQRSCITLHGGCSLAAFAAAFAKGTELKLVVHTLHYSFQRDHDWVRVGLFDNDTGSSQNWLAPAAEFLGTLNGLGARAA
jgi:hypothetical protein